MPKTKVSDAKKLEKELMFSFKNIAKEEPLKLKEADKFCEGYKEYLDRGKTERECAKYTEKLLLAAGYRPFEPGMQLTSGDKVYTVNREKAIIAATIGKKPVTEGVRFNIAHIDSPRLDLKPNPMYEKDEIAYLKTHYYGGIRKYQWATIPLSMHGVVFLKNGKKIELAIGEKEGDTRFVITDLLPHLSAKQNERPLKDGIKGEELNIVIGSVPYPDEDVKNAFKLMALKLLNDEYGITEADFLRAEIEMVPSGKATDIGFDRSMIGAYGQDDRVCAYTAVMAEIKTKSPEHTTVTVLTDKEEIGSKGNTGMSSRYLHHFMEDISDIFGVKVRDIYRNSICLSSDVNAAYDPTFPDVYEPANASYINHGPVITKYTGSRGKSGSNDASAETMAKVTGIMDGQKVYWQIGELGKVDEGGGGTIAHFMSDWDVDTVDVGVPVLAMHAPFEITSKLDVLYTYKAFKAFYK